MMTVNTKTVKKCAFCKYWYDPTNSAISPRSPKINLWEYDDKAKCKCLQKNYDMKARRVLSRVFSTKVVLFFSYNTTKPLTEPLDSPISGFIVLS